MKLTLVQLCFVILCFNAFKLLRDSYILKVKVDAKTQERIDDWKKEKKLEVGIIIQI